MKALKNICKNCKHYKACESPCAFVEQLLNGSQGLCDSCPHKEHCTKPCFFAECLIEADVKPFFEQSKTEVRNGQEVQVTVVYDPHGYYVSRFSDLIGIDKEGDEISGIETKSNEEVQAFYDGIFYVRTQKLGIFIDRFFNNFNYEDLAVKYETTSHQAMKVYDRAKTDFLSFLDAWNREKEVLNNRRRAESHLQNMPKMSKKLKSFLLHHVFELSYAEIAEILEVPRQHISREIKSVEENAKQGINLLQFENGKIRASTPEEIRQQRNGGKR